MRCQEVQPVIPAARMSATIVAREAGRVIRENTPEMTRSLRLAATPGRAVPLQTPMAQDPLVGRTIAGYTLHRGVGEGGTAQVYQAEHPERGVVALKVLRPR